MLTKRNFRDLTKFTSALPSHDALERYRQIHQDLIAEFFILRNESTLLGECLKARFGGGGGNPADKALKKGEIDDYRSEIIWALVDCYQAIFILIQMNWGTIKKNIKEYIDEYLPDSCFESEVFLFFEILREHYDGSFQRCVDGWNFTPSHAKNRAVILRKMVEAIDKSTTLVLASHEERQKLGLPKTMKYFFLLPTVLELARKNCRRKPSLTTYYHSCWQALSRVADIHERWASQHRGRNRARAVKWHKGQFFVGTQGGYVPVTKLNQTFSESFEKKQPKSSQGKETGNEDF